MYSYCLSASSQLAQEKFRHVSTLNSQLTGPSNQSLREDGGAWEYNLVSTIDNSLAGQTPSHAERVWLARLSKQGEGESLERG